MLFNAEEHFTPWVAKTRTSHFSLGLLHSDGVYPLLAKSDVSRLHVRSLSECTVSVLTPVPNYTCKWLITWTSHGERRWKSLLHHVSVSVQGIFLTPWTVEIDIRVGPRAGRLSSEHMPFGPKTLPISGPWAASCTGVAGYLRLFVRFNPTQFKPGLAACTFKLIRWHLRGPATESRTELLLLNEIWLIDFRVASLECLRWSRQMNRDGSYLFPSHV